MTQAEFDALKQKPLPDRPRYHSAESKTEPGLVNARLTSMSPERWQDLQKILDAQGFKSY